MKQRFLILICLFICNTIVSSAQGVDEKRSISEIKTYLNARIDEIKSKKLDAINNLFELRKFKIITYDDLKAYNNSYSKYLEEDDKKYYSWAVNHCKEMIDVQECHLFMNKIEATFEKLDKKATTAQTLEEGAVLQHEFDELSDELRGYTKKTKKPCAVRFSEMQGSIGFLKSKINRKRIKLSQDIVIETDICKVIALDWVLEKQQINIKEGPSKTDKSIAKINKVLKEKYTSSAEENPGKKVSPRQKNLIKKLEKLKITAAAERAENTEIIARQPISILVTFCQKKLRPTGSEKELVLYWGVSEVKVPNDRATENSGGLNYTFSSDISSKGFSDVAIINAGFVREKADNEISRSANINWTLVISTDPDNLDVDISINVNPEEGLVLKQLDYKDIERPGTYISFEGNLEEASADFIKLVKERLHLK